MRSQFDWYKMRLAAMSVPELAYRLAQSVSKQAGRWHSRGWKAVKLRGDLAAVTGLNARLNLLSPELVLTLAREATEICAGRFHFLGASWPEPNMPPAPRFWHVDPEDGEVVPRWNAYCFNHSFGRGVTTREIKRIWELNRLRFLVPLAANAVLSKDERDAKLIIQVIQSWMEGNPPFVGPNWGSGIELAMRVISVALSLSIIGVERLDDNSRRSALQFFFAHLYWIRRFSSLYSSANNHRIAELAGLVVGAAAAPAFPAAADLREASWRSLLIEIEKQIYPDGVGAEQAPSYTAFSVELFLVAAAAYGKHRDFPSATADRLAAWAEHSLWLMDSEGSLPAIGDFDDGSVIATTQSPEFRYVASIVSAVAGCIERPDQLLLTKSPASETSYLIQLGHHQRRDREFVHLQLGAIRSSAAAKFLLFWFSITGRWAISPSLPTGMRMHLPCGCRSETRPLFVDAGTYLYHSDRVLRDLFRETAVHNTLILDGMSSSRCCGPFNWATKANAQLIGLEKGSVTRVVAEHDGYLLSHGVRHRRTVEFDGGTCITIIDQLLGNSSTSQVALGFLLSTRFKASSGARRKRYYQQPRPKDDGSPQEFRSAQGQNRTSRRKLGPRLGIAIIWHACSLRSNSFRREAGGTIVYCNRLVSLKSKSSSG